MLWGIELTDEEIDAFRKRTSEDSKSAGQEDSFSELDLMEIDTYRLDVDNLPGGENRFPDDREAVVDPGEPSRLCVPLSCLAWIGSAPHATRSCRLPPEHVGEYRMSKHESAEGRAAHAKFRRSLREMEAMASQRAILP
jgi:hypothetical protein